MPDSQDSNVHDWLAGSRHVFDLQYNALDVWTRHLYGARAQFGTKLWIKVRIQNQNPNLTRTVNSARAARHFVFGLLIACFSGPHPTDPPLPKPIGLRPILWAGLEIALKNVLRKQAPTSHFDAKPPTPIEAPP